VISNATLRRRWLMIWFAFWASIIFIPTYQSSLSPPFCPFWARVALFVLGGSIRRITLEEAKRPN